MNSSAPIGVFDSGVGGLSIWRELVRELPAESTIYVADSAHAPYGIKSRKYITERSRSITQFLVDQGCKLILVACNTATGASISTLRQEFELPFIGVEPAVKPAAIESHTGHIGILATAQTFNGEHFKRSIELYGQSVQLHFQAGTGLVELIETGRINSPETRELLLKYLVPMVESGIDQLVLGCTHYPFLIPLIREIVPPRINVVDPAPAVARQVRKVLEEYGGFSSSSHPAHRFLTTGNPDQFSRMISDLIGMNFPVSILG